MQEENEIKNEDLMRHGLKPMSVTIVILFLLLFVGLIVLLRFPVANSGTDTTGPFTTLPPLRSEFTSGAVTLKEKPVIDLSGWQLPKNLDYDKLASEVNGVIVRVQHGTSQKADTAVKSNGEDTAFQAHISAFQKRGVPVAVYAYVDGSSVSEMKSEADSFYNRAKAYQPTFWWLDVEVANMKDLNAGVQAFREELARLGVTNVGIYSQVWFLSAHALDVTPFAATWLAYYGPDDGDFEGSPQTSINYAMQQYTSQGWLSGYDGALDFSRVSSQAAYNKIFLNK